MEQAGDSLAPAAPEPVSGRWFAAARNASTFYFLDPPVQAVIPFAEGAEQSFSAPPPEASSTRRSLFAMSSCCTSGAPMNSDAVRGPHSTGPMKSRFPTPTPLWRKMA